jgi:hypothetical protein
MTSERHLAFVVAQAPVLSRRQSRFAGRARTLQPGSRIQRARPDRNQGWPEHHVAASTARHPRQTATSTDAPSPPAPRSHDFRRHQPGGGYCSRTTGVTTAGAILGTRGRTKAGLTWRAARDSETAKRRSRRRCYVVNALASARWRDHGESSGATARSRAATSGREREGGVAVRVATNAEGEA